MHFLKVIDFTSDEGMTKPQILFMYLLFNYIYENHTKDQIKSIFQKTFKTGQSKPLDANDSDDHEHGIAEDKLADFKKGISEYVLTQFYVKKRKEAEKQEGVSKKMPSELQEKFKVTFDLINKQQEGEFIKDHKF